MPGRKKKFIDKKNAVTFHLVHRSQRDPLQADEEASSHVLLEQVSEQDKVEARKEEQRKYGIFFDDEYDYLQHLKDANELREVGPSETFRIAQSGVRQRGSSEITVLEEIPESKEPKLKLPSSVFASETETSVGMLNKAAPDRDPKFDWDPDVVAALDDDFDFDDPENQLDDDFMAAANAEGGELGDSVPKAREDMGRDEEEEQYSDIDSEGGYPSDEADWIPDNVSDVGSLGQHSFMDEETKSRFTSYSMTSSVIRRNKGLTMLDDRFEQMYAEYDDTELGALDHEDIDGTLQQNSEMLNSIMDEFEKQQQKKNLKNLVEKADDVVVASESDEDNEDDLVKMTLPEEKEQWDCESIISTYSNLYNHPKLIEEPKRGRSNHLPKTSELPEDAITSRGLTQRQIAEMNREDRADRACTYRPKNESAEERRARKAAVKDERRARREEKKANKEAFKSEKIKQDKELINVQKNLQGIKMV